MALSQPRTVFGVHSLTAIKRSNGMPYGQELRVLSGSNFTLSGDLVELKGGSLPFSWSVENGDIDATLGFSASEYPNWIFEVMGGKAPTVGSAEASGNVSALTNKFGTSMVAATGLLGTITVSTAANLKAGKYAVQATAADAFKVYAMTDVDFGRGTDLDFTDDTMEIAAFTGVAGSGSTHVIAALGITFTTGASAAAFVTGDTAIFDIRPVNTLNRTVKIGGIADEFPEFSALVAAQKSGSGAVFLIEIYKLKAIGLGLGAERKAFGANEYEAKASYDSVENAICKVTEVE